MHHLTECVSSAWESKRNKVLREGIQKGRKKERNQVRIIAILGFLCLKLQTQTQFVSASINVLPIQKSRKGQLNT